MRGGETSSGAQALAIALRKAPEARPTQAPLPRTLLDLFAAQCEISPQSLAVATRGARQTYAELESESRLWARKIVAAGLGPGDRVLVCVERTLELPAILLGVIRSGACYVPIDPGFPRERVEMIAADACPSAAIVSAGTQALLAKQAPVQIKAGSEAEPEGNLPLPDPSAFDPESLAYLIFTSGSTGRPKGVPITHRALVNFLVAMARTPGIQASDRVLALTTISFDISVLELFLPLIAGASAFIASEDDTLDPEQLAGFIQSNRLTLLQATPATWQLLTDYGWKPTAEQRILCGGEAFPIALAETLNCHAAAVWNMYGPTEATIWSSCHRVEEPDIRRGRIPLGVPIAGLRYHIEPLEEHDSHAIPSPEPGRRIGELWIAGVGVTPGYFQRPELNRERFRERDEGGIVQRYYRTGDVVESDSKRRLFFRDRLDNQVKVRGFRVELGEIESALADFEPVGEGVVILAEPEPGEPVLVGCVRLTQTCTDQQLEAHLRTRLPEYMIPRVWHRLERMPQTPNRKIDRRALKEQVTPAHPGPEPIPSFSEPLQRDLAELWTTLLGVAPERTTDDFLALGGHSLLAARLSALIETRLSRKVRPVDLLRTSTLAAQAQLIAGAANIQVAATSTATEALPARIDLSPAQRRMWFTGELMNDHRVYHESEAYRIHGPVDAARLQKVVEGIFKRHPALGLRLQKSAADRPEWFAAEGASVPFVVEQCSADRIQPRHLSDVLGREARRAFRLDNEPLIRFHLYTDGAVEHVLQCTAHHMIIDGMSQTRLWQEIAQGYRTDDSAAGDPVETVDNQFVQGLGRSSDYDPRDLAFWRTEFETPAPTLELVTDKPRPSRFDYSAHQVEVASAPDTVSQLHSAVRQLKTTPFVLLLSCYAAFLERYAQQGEYVIGTPVSGRAPDTGPDAIGLFINTIPLRIAVKPAETLKALVNRVREQSLRAFAHEQVPFDHIVAAVNPPRELSRTPLYQTLFTLNDFSERPAALSAESPWQPETIDTGYAPAELVLFADLSDGQLRLRLQGSKQLFARETLAGMLQHFQQFVEHGLSHLDQPHDAVSMLETGASAEPAGCNNTTVDYPRDSSITACFQAQAERSPDSVALELGSLQISYSALSGYARGIAEDLTQAGVKPGDKVGLAAGRSVEAVGAMLGILEAGAVYVPLDLSYPRARLQVMLETGQVNQVLVKPNDEHRFNIDAGKPRLIPLRGFDAVPEGPSLAANGPGAESAAYVMFTSGSTGTPKGIEVSHRNVLRLVKNANFMDLGAHTRFMMYAPISFDASNLELWGSLLNGGTLVIPEMENPTGEDLQAIIHEHQINSVWLTTALFHYMAEHHAAAFAHARYLLTGGEMLSAKWARHVLETNPGLTLINCYGPTENTTFSSFYPMGAPADVTDPIPIGRPISNSTVHVVGSDGRLCPINVPGELWVGGEGVALGYVGQPDLTQNVFVADPFSQQQGARAYRTGDRVRWRPDGNLEFLGRLDNQVKIRGHRIEPDEVTAILESCPGIAQAVTVPWTAPSGERQLVSYVTSSGAQVDTRDLQARLAESLPQYMRPAHIVSLVTMPIGPAGKIDRRALPEPDTAASVEQRVNEPPMTATEQSLAEIWKAVLGLNRVGRHDNFFALGGSSIKALAVFTRIEQDLGFDIPLSVLLAKPTLVELAAALDLQSPQPKPAPKRTFDRPWESLVVMEPGGSLQPIVCIHAVGGNVLSYRGLLNVAGADRPILGFQSQGLDGLRAPQRSIRRMAEDYVAELLASDYRGPYILLGGSMGGTIALEMAAILESKGEQVDWVVLLDSVGPEGRVIPPEKPSIQFSERFWKSVRARTDYYLKASLTWGYRQFHVRLPYWLRPFFIEKEHKIVLANHREKPYWGKVLLLRGPEKFKGVYSDPCLGWNGTLKGKILIEEIDAPHGDFLESSQTQSRLKAFFEEHCWNLYDTGEDCPGQTK